MVQIDKQTMSFGVKRFIERKKQDMNFFDNDNIRLCDDYPNYKRIQAFDSQVTLKTLKNQPKIALFWQMTIDDIIPSEILFDEC